jgi:invasion protein IalB
MSNPKTPQGTFIYRLSFDPDIRKKWPPGTMRIPGPDRRRHFDSDRIAVAFYHVRQLRRHGRRRPAGIDLFACACMKASDHGNGAGLSRIRLNWLGDSRATARCCCPQQVRGAPVQKGFSAMNFRILAAPFRPRCRVLALMAVTAMTATFLTPDLRAQTPTPAPATPAPKEPKAKTAAPKPAPKAAPAPAPSAQPAQQPPAAAAPSAQPPDQQVQLIYAPWTKFCLKGQDANAKQVCFTGKDGRIESGQPVVAAVVIEPEGEPKKILRVTLPLGMLLVHGTRVIVDNNPPAQSPYVICFANGCMSDYEVTPELLANMKKGQNLIIQAINSNQQPITLPLPLADFAKAYDGPPTDPKVFEETQKKLQEELQKRAEEARKKLEANQPQAGANANPAAK